MRLNGINPRPGTIIGYHQRALRFLAVDTVDSKGCILRFAEANEVSVELMGKHAPQSVVEHRAIRRQQTVYGLARVYGHNGYKPSPKVRA